MCIYHDYHRCEPYIPSHKTRLPLVMYIVSDSDYDVKYTTYFRFGEQDCRNTTYSEGRLVLCISCFTFIMHSSSQDYIIISCHLLFSVSDSNSTNCFRSGVQDCRITAHSERKLVTMLYINDCKFLLTYYYHGLMIIFYIRPNHYTTSHKLNARSTWRSCSTASGHPISHSSPRS